MLDDKQAKPDSTKCDRCHGEVWTDEVMYLWEDKRICLDCFKAAVSALLEDNPVQVAQEMGVDMERVG